MSNVRNPSRRRIITSAAAGASLPLLAPLANTARAHGSELFSLGVGSGEPHARSVVLWTRLAKDPLAPDGGMPRWPIPVSWEVAVDPQMRHVVKRGFTLAFPRLAHSVRAKVHGLRPDSWYFYRFRVGNEDSPKGRTRTFPQRRADARRMRFALASCQDYQNGFYAAYRDMAEQDLDFVVHVGDYIYEGARQEGAPRQVSGAETITLDDYRVRYAEYRLDPALQAAHAAFPWIVTTDDHEVDDDRAGLVPQDDQDPEAFAARTAAAYQAYYEHMPLRPFSRPFGTHIRLFRRLHFGRLATFHVLDTRQFRTPQPCFENGDTFAINCEDLADPDATMTGERQEAWLERGLAHSKALWNVMAQQTMFTKWDMSRILTLTGLPPGNTLFNVDAWDGYQAQRRRLTDFLARVGPSNPIILTGDIHSSWAAEILEDFEEPDSGVVASEFVGTSIASDFPAEFVLPVQLTLADNPHIRYFDGVHRGYVTFDVTDQTWRADFKGVANLLDPASPVSTLASFVTQAGYSGILPA